MQLVTGRQGLFLIVVITGSIQAAAGAPALTKRSEQPGQAEDQGETCDSQPGEQSARTVLPCFGEQAEDCGEEEGSGGEAEEDHDERRGNCKEVCGNEAARDGR